MQTITAPAYTEPTAEHIEQWAAAARSPLVKQDLLAKAAALRAAPAYTESVLLTRAQHDAILDANRPLLARAFAESSATASTRWSIGGVRLKLTAETAAEIRALIVPHSALRETKIDGTTPSGHPFTITTKWDHATEIARSLEWHPHNGIGAITVPMRPTGSPFGNLFYELTRNGQASAATAKACFLT